MIDVRRENSRFERIRVDEESFLEKFVDLFCGETTEVQPMPMETLSNQLVEARVQLNEALQKFEGGKIFEEIQNDFIRHGFKHRRLSHVFKSHRREKKRTAADNVSLV